MFPTHSWTSIFTGRYCLFFCLTRHNAMVTIKYNDTNCTLCFYFFRAKMSLFMWWWPGCHHMTIILCQIYLLVSYAISCEYTLQSFTIWIVCALHKKWITITTIWHDSHPNSQDDAATNDFILLPSWELDPSY